MSETLLSSRNLAFELYEVLDAEALTRRERFAEHSRETFDAAIGTARTIAEKFFAPHNRKNDENEPRYENGEAILIPEVKPAVDAFLEAGFLNAARDFEAGGMQLPTLLSQACFAHFQSANAASSSAVRCASVCTMRRSDAAPAAAAASRIWTSWSWS